MSLSADTFMFVLSDSLFMHHDNGSDFVTKRLYDAYGSCEAVLCIASGAALAMPYGGYCALGVFLTALKDERLSKRLSSDPTVRVLVVNPAMSTAKCRTAGEQYPDMVGDRCNLSLLTQHTPPWTICDLEDCVMGSEGRNIFPVLEACELERPRGIYGKCDDIHFTSRDGVAAGKELLLALRRQAIHQYHGLLQNSILLVLASGWNAEGTEDKSAQGGTCWRKAELITSLELCALNGHPLSAVREHAQYLLRRAKGDHMEEFVKVPAKSIVPVKPGTTTPRGGYGGWLFDDENSSGIRAVTVRQVLKDGDELLCFIETRHADGSSFRVGRAEAGREAGTFEVPAGRWIKKVFERTGWHVNAISFELDDGSESDWFGGEGGEEHCCEAADGQYISGFHGRAGDVIDSLGVRFAPRLRRRDAGGLEDMPAAHRRRLADAEPAAVDDELFARLLQYGFDGDAARAALLQCAGHFENAITLLTSQ